MRASLRFFVGLGVLSLLALPALAQRQPFGLGGMMGQGGAAALLMNKSVQDELKMTEEQKGKMSGFQQKMFENMKDVFGKLQDVKPEERREKLQEIMKELTASSDKMVKEILKPEQAKRLQQIEMQQAGIRNLVKEDIQKTLKLNDDQKDKLKTISDDVAKDVQEIFRDAGRDPQKMTEARKKMEGVRKEALEKANAILTAEQKKALKDLMGEPFELKIERPNFPGFPGGERPPERKPAENK